MKAKVIIVMKGGLVQQVIANGAVEVLTLDQDIEGGAQEHIREISLGGFTPSQVLRRLRRSHSGRSAAR